MLDAVQPGCWCLLCTGGSSSAAKAAQAAAGQQGATPWQVLAAAVQSAVKVHCGYSNGSACPAFTPYDGKSIAHLICR